MKIYYRRPWTSIGRHLFVKRTVTKKESYSGTQRVLRLAIALPILLSSVMTLSAQLPLISDARQGPYHHCIGRFEGEPTLNENGGLHRTKVVFLVLTQQLQVRFQVFPKIFSANCSLLAQQLWPSLPSVPLGRNTECHSVPLNCCLSVH